MKGKRYAAGLLDAAFVVGILVVLGLGAFCGVRLLVRGMVWFFQQLF